MTFLLDRPLGARQDVWPLRENPGSLNDSPLDAPMLTVLALSPSAKIAMVLIAGIIVFPLVDLYLGWLTKHRQRVRRTLYREARDSHAGVLAGLREMAEVFTHLPEHPLELSKQGVSLLDAQARAADSFDKLCRRYATMSRERKLRALTREWWRFHDQEALFETFQRQVLRAASDQARRGIVSPPVPGRCYRAIFTVLNHDLPGQLWPAMDRILSKGVTLKMQDVAGWWHPVPLNFSSGSRAVFSRIFLERATALKVIIEHTGADREVFEYGVSHTLPVKPMWGIKRRLARFSPSRSFGSALSPM